MTERCIEALELLHLAAGKLREAATEGPAQAVWVTKLSDTARVIEVIAERVRRWLVGDAGRTA